MVGTPASLTFDELGLAIHYYTLCSAGDGGPSRVHHGPACGSPIVQHQRAKVYSLSTAAVGAVKRDFRQQGDAIVNFLVDSTVSELLRLSSTAQQTGRCDVEVKGVLHTLTPAHLEVQEQQGSLGWVKVDQGCLSAAGAPSIKTTREWAREGVTCVVSLLRENEPRFIQARDACMAESFRWEHVPLSGKGAVTHPSAEDLESWTALQELLPSLMAQGECVVVHCAAGMHRTGTAVFSALRHCRFTAQDALEAIKMMRPVTHGELVKVEKCGKTLWEIAEDVACSDIA